MLNIKNCLVAFLLPLSFCQASHVLDADVVELPKAKVMVLYHGKDTGASFQHNGFKGYLTPYSMIACEVGDEFLHLPDEYPVVFKRNWQNHYQHHRSDGPPMEIMEKMMKGEPVAWQGRSGVVDLLLEFTKENDLSGLEKEYVKK